MKGLARRGSTKQSAPRTGMPAPQTEQKGSRLLDALHKGNLAEAERIMDEHLEYYKGQS
jgi:DNA-binding FadR family transcriptional regulator